MIDHPYPNKISVCMIVRNEEKNISPAIESFLPIADEIVINDTGSTDKTVDIIHGLNNDKIELIEFDWNDDFSQARNATLHHAKYGWIIWLDADDRIPTDMIIPIKKLAKAPLDRAFIWRICNSRTDKIQGGPEFWQTRMFPNHEKIRFRKRVHESATKSIEEMGLPKYHVDISINHLGYNNETLNKEKAERNLKLQLMDPCETPLDYLHLARSYTRLNKWEKAIENYTECWNTPDLENKFPDFHYTTSSEIGRCYMKLRDYEKALEWFSKSDKGNIEAAFLKANCLEAIKEYSKAVWAYYHVLSLPKVVKSVSMDYHACRVYTFHYLLRLLVCMKMHSKAIALVHKMVEQYPEEKSICSDFL